MAAAAVAVALSIRLERRVPLMPLIGCGFVLAFGGLTLALDDDLFIKIKPTVVNLLFAAVLFSGLALRRDWLKLILGQMMSLTDRGWRILTWRWAVFFVFLAIVNEVVWRSFSTEFWAGFKLFGMLPLTMTFALLQVPTILKHAAEEEAEAEPGRPAAAEADD
jgi:intracellular septation protein